MQDEKIVIIKAAQKDACSSPKYPGALFSADVPGDGQTRGLTRRFPAEFRSYTGMKDRSKQRGWPVHPWLSTFEKFMQCLGPKGHPDDSLDRIDNAKPYAPGNIRWASKRTQANNRSSTVLLKCNGHERPLTEWAAITGVSPDTIRRRLQRGWPAENAITGARPTRKASGEHLARVAQDLRDRRRVPLQEPLTSSIYRAARHELELSRDAAEGHGGDIPAEWVERTAAALAAVTDLEPLLRASGVGRWTIEDVQAHEALGDRFPLLGDR